MGFFDNMRGAMGAQQQDRQIRYIVTPEGKSAAMEGLPGLSGEILEYMTESRPLTWQEIAKHINADRMAANKPAVNASRTLDEMKWLYRHGYIDKRQAGGGDVQ